MRIGINSGMVQSGIIGMHKWQFDIWSMDCLLASQMEQDGVPGCVHITKKTYDLLPKDKLSEYNIVGNCCCIFFFLFLFFINILHYLISFSFFRKNNQ